MFSREVVPPLRLTTGTLGISVAGREQESFASVDSEHTVGTVNSDCSALFIVSRGNCNEFRLQVHVPVGLAFVCRSCNPRLLQGCKPYANS
jgi:hypothetical protein